MKNANVFAFSHRNHPTGKEYHVHAEKMVEFAIENEIDQEVFNNNVALKNHIARNEKGYEVGAVIGHRKHDGRWELLIHWKGYANNHDSWEPADVINADIPVMVKQYLKKNQKDKMVKQLMKQLQLKVQ